MNTADNHELLHLKTFSDEELEVFENKVDNAMMQALNLIKPIEEDKNKFLQTLNENEIKKYSGLSVEELMFKADFKKYYLESQKTLIHDYIRSQLSAKELKLFNSELYQNEN